MAKLTNKQIEVDDFKEYLNDASDFAFELSVLKMLREPGFDCQHGGTYEDPQTSKLRQFDIRASMKLGYAYLHVAVECKQVRDHFPLLVMRVPRRREESFHDILLTIDQEKWRLERYPTISAMQKRGTTIRVKNSNPLYASGESVGKSCAQVGRDANGITGTDSEVFAKWSQAISSAQGIIDDAFEAVPTDRDGWWLSLVLPVIVIPDDRLWVVDYDQDGNQVSEPTRVSRCSYYISADSLAGDKLVGVPYVLSHLEFITMSGLKEFVSLFGNKQVGPDDLIFPIDKAARQLHK